MNLAPAQLAEHLKRGLKSLCALNGDEPLLGQAFAGARQQGGTERAVHTIFGAHFDWSEVLARQLQAAQQAGGIVKGLKPDWPASGWQALHRPATMVCELSAARRAPPGAARG